MKALALGVLVQFLVAAGAHAQAPAPLDPELAIAHSKQVVEDTMRLTVQPGMRVGLAYAVCGEENAAYDPRTHHLIVCLEIMHESDEVLQFVVAHEMAHAIIDQYNIPVPASEEAAADELAAVLMGMNDKSGTTLATALWYREQADQTEDPEDDHQSNAKRAAVLICLGDGSTPDPANVGCYLRYGQAVRVWSRLILTFGPH